MSENRGALIAAAVIMAGFALFAFFLPDIMLAVGQYSTWAAGAIGVVFVGGLFVILWLRGVSQRRKGD